MKKEKGITLIALVITIIVLLILAGVSIAMLTGENGILTQTNSAKYKTEQSTLLEELRLKMFEKTLDENLKELDEETYLKQQGILKNENNEIDLSKLSSTYSTGKGSFTEGDIYYAKDGDLYYKDSNGQETNIGKIFSVEASLTQDIYTYSDEQKTILIGVQNQYKRNTTASLSPKKIASLDISNIKASNKNSFYDIIYDEKIVTNLVLPNTIKTIYNYSFENAISIEKVKIQQGCTSIGTGAFVNCSSLTSIEIPSSVTSISNDTFINCNPNLKVLIHNTKENLPFSSNWRIDENQVIYLGN